jgi:hypothetical protein
MRKHTSEELDSLIKSSDLGKLKKKEWLPWSRSLKNYLSTITRDIVRPLLSTQKQHQQQICDGNAATAMGHPRITIDKRSDAGNRAKLAV